jgi:transposase InsO family protein
MEERAEVKQKETRKGSKNKAKFKVYSYEERLRIVKMRVEEKYPIAMICRETGVSDSAIKIWVTNYRKHGEAGLKSSRKPMGVKRLPEAVTEKIVELKRENAGFGVKRISDVLKRLFWLSASPETVRQRLHEAELMDPKTTARKKNPGHPRFFERATPNQMWQTDIFTFRLGGKYAYIVAFMDDYSRYLVGLDLFRSPTAEAVIETYRVACGEYQPPKEMLTDNGRQYINWRGKSRFGKELEKDRVKHIVSRPQHPQTLGKVERFWESIWNEFLVRAQFGSFEEARERIRLWVKYYNHRRPHQGIEGLCPADRYFEIAHEMKKTMEQGIAENVLEMALRGKPLEPFYMVGRMEGQSVVLRAEKGKLKLSVEENNKIEKELVYELGKNSGEEKNQSVEKTREDDQSGGTSAGSAGGLDGSVQAGGGMPGVGHPLGDVLAVAGPGDGGNVASARTESESDAGGVLESEVTAVALQEAAGNGEPLGAAASNPKDQENGGRSENGVNEHERKSEAAGAGDPASEDGENDGDGGSAASGDLAQDVLRVGKAGSGGDDGGAGGSRSGTACGADGSEEGGDGGQNRETLGSGEGAGSGGGHPGGDDKNGCHAGI